MFTFYYTEWAKAYAKAGPLGIGVEAFCATIGTSAWPFFIESTGDWGRKQIQALLESHGVTIWGWGYSQGKFMFRVKKRQAYWAEYLMLKNDVPVTGTLLHKEFPQTRVLPVYLNEQDKHSIAPPDSLISSERVSQTKRRPVTLDNSLSEINNLVNKLANIKF